jgi:GNAT superfamily N-acetyltransferase
MSIFVRVCEPDEIAQLRECYREEMDCQIIHDSIHARRGLDHRSWSVEYALDFHGALVGYGSVAVAGPWTTSHALYEFYVKRDCRGLIFDFFAAMLATCDATMIETQTNAPILPIMLHTFGHNVRAEAILFKDGFETQLAPEGSGFRPAEAGDGELLKSLDRDTAGWVVTFNGEIAGAGGVLYHYNRPYGDIYMKIAEPFRGKGLGAYLVQELKAACRVGGSVPAARCNIGNLASRRTLQKAGFVPCGNLVACDLMKDAQS